MDKFIDGLKNHWLVVAILLGSALISAASNYEKLASWIFPDAPDNSHFEGEICADRGEGTICSDLNSDFMTFVAFNTGTGRPASVHMTYLVDLNVEDPCNTWGGQRPPGLNGSKNSYTGPGWTTFYFYSRDHILRNDAGFCVTRVTQLHVPKQDIQINYLNQSGDRYQYVISGEFLITSMTGSGSSPEDVWLNPL